MGRKEQIKPQATRRNQEEEFAWLLFLASRDTVAGMLHLCVCCVVPVQLWLHPPLTSAEPEVTVQNQVLGSPVCTPGSAEDPESVE